MVMERVHVKFSLLSLKVMEYHQYTYTGSRTLKVCFSSSSPSYHHLDPHFLFIGLSSLLNPFALQFSIISAILHLFALVTCRGQLDLHLLIQI